MINWILSAQSAVSSYSTIVPGQEGTPQQSQAWFYWCSINYYHLWQGAYCYSYSASPHSVPQGLYEIVADYFSCLDTDLVLKCHVRYRQVSKLDLYAVFSIGTFRLHWVLNDLHGSNSSLTSSSCLRIVSWWTTCSGQQ